MCMTIYLIAQEMTISHNFFYDFKKYFNIIILMLSLADILFLLNIIKQNENYSMGLSYSLLFYLSVYSICKKKR